ncbi:hypothetical protein Verru16b_01527 [Lacunisphaera limnophila]|uniref:Uncharacterized protein n=1 Tax=Lacunisphaera limnophila TaxID=1838286 RepID=A0A1D8AU93_9BACT|nr:hypothetical protein [Lacunisphaera limnophila]AOS44465.1 hypothetical protein Verru16b_01527 [Lacunisphaera limnophila]
MSESEKDPAADQPAPLPDASVTPADSQPQATPATPAAPTTPADPAAPAAPAADAPKPPAPVLTPIDYAMPQSKSFIPSPALIKNLGCIFKMLFGFTVLLILGYVMLMALNPKARQWALQGSQPGSAGAGADTFGSGAAGSGLGGGRGPTPFKAVNQILAIPAQALGKTDDVVKANNARAGLLDGMIAQEENQAKGTAPGSSSRPAYNPFASDAAKAGPAAPGKAAKPGEPLSPEDERAANAARLLALQERQAAAAAAGTLPPAAPVNAVRATAVAQTVEVLAPVTLPGGIVIRGASPDGTPPPTRTFFYWVVNLTIGAVNPPRVLINGRLVHEKQEISIPQGITLSQLDSAHRLLVFQDKTGAIVTRSY